MNEKKSFIALEGNKGPILRESVSYHPKQNALLVGAPYLAEAGCCEVIEPVLSFTLDNPYLVNFIVIYFIRKDKFHFLNKIVEDQKNNYAIMKNKYLWY